MLPVYGFLQGDTLGILLFAYGDETIASLTNKLQLSAKLRVPLKKKPAMFFLGEQLDESLLVSQTSIKALDRVDVVETSI